MRKYGHWSRLPVTAYALAGALSVGCGDVTNQNEKSAPHFMPVEELAPEYENRVGDAVIVEGQLVVTDDGQYFLRQSVDSGHRKEGMRLALKFESDNVNDHRMKKCLSGPTLVTGVLQHEYEIRVKYVKLTSDTRAHRPDECYRYSD